MISHKDAYKRAQRIVAQMTTEEMASQLSYISPAIPRLGIPAYNWWNEALHGVARAGTATVFPQAIGLAAIFDEKTHGQIADVIATEGRAKYNAARAHGDRDIYKGLTFWSPNINIFRDPRWGRGQETYGEDPVLTARLGVTFVKHLQGHGKYLKAAACAKHFAVHSGPEKGRHSFDAVAGKKDMRETYLYAFEKLVRDADVESVMGAYNRVNGEPACGSKTLLKDILRDEWGFEGHVVSDCWAIRDFHEHHCVTATAPESAALAMKYGCDLNCGNTYLHLLAALQEGRVTEEQLSTAASRLLATRIRLGMFDDDCAYDGITLDENDTKKHASLALRAAQKSIVLLKNDGILPLDKHKIKTIAVIGPNADSLPALEGNYNGTSSRYVTYLEGIRAALPRAEVRYALGCHLYKDRVSNLAQAEDRLSEAVATAESADVVVLCLGLDPTIEGEEGDTGNEHSSGDKKDLRLPAPQRELLSRIEKTGKPLVILLCAGSALAVESGNAVLQCWYAGQAGGKAAADILLGRVSPSGKLPVTFYKGVDDLPEFTDYAMQNRTYRYYRGEPLYPFGFGLSYVKFAYSGLDVKGDTVRVTVKNKGDMTADEVVQAYIKANDDPCAVPNHSLCAFARVTLKKGEKKDITLKIPKDAFESVSDEGVRAVRGKRFTIFVGGCQPDARSKALGGAWLEKNIEV